MSSCAECPGHLLCDKFPISREYIADGRHPGVRFAGRGVEYETLRDVIDMVAMSENESLDLVRKRLHLRYDLRADVSRHLLEHHQSLAVPPVATDSISLAYERKYLLEGEPVGTPADATFYR